MAAVFLAEMISDEPVLTSLCKILDGVFLPRAPGGL